MIWRLDQRGDSLVEVILALVILTAVLITALTISRLTRVGSVNSGQRAQAINLMQEQYEALKYYRNHNSWADFLGNGSSHPCPVGVGAWNEKCSGVSRMTYMYTNTMGSWPGGADCDTNTPGIQFCFHMERQSDSNMLDSVNVIWPGSYGQWVPCPGPWYPPAGADTTGWNSTPSAAEQSDIYYTGVHAAFGCRGSYRNQNNPTSPQNSIQVAIYFQPTNTTLGLNVADTVNVKNPNSTPSVNQPYVCNLGANTSPAQSLTFDIRGTWVSGGAVSTRADISTLLANIAAPPGPPVQC